MTERPLVAAVVPVHNRLESTRRFVESFRGLSHERKLLVICDDGSNDGTAEYLRGQTDVRVVRGDGNLWWSGGTNAAIREALGREAEYVLTINDDSELEPDYLDRLLGDARKHPGSIMASSLVQLQAPDRHWSLGASYLNYGNVLYVNDCCGASAAHISGLMQPTVLVDTMPGNGVLYPARVFAEAGGFDETWTPQYHGDTLFVHRAARKGFVPRLSLRAVVKNDMAHHLEPKHYDPLLSLKSPHYAPAVYKSVEEREGEDAALDFLGGLSAALPSEFCPAAGAAWKERQGGAPTRDFVFDPHFAHTLPGGAFAFLGYEATRGLRVRPGRLDTHFQPDLCGQGVLTLVLRVRRDCGLFVFVVTSQKPGHVDVLARCRRRGAEPFGEEWLAWFQVEAEASDLVRIPLAVINRQVPWRGIYLAVDENVAARFRGS